jgi:hypothetical protein
MLIQLANTTRVYYGDMMFIYAFSSINEGEELTTSYVRTDYALDKREQVLKKWGFKCECKLCTLDRSEPEAEKQRQMLTARMEEIKSV